MTNSYFTSEVKIRALRLGVELIDRDELQNLWHARESEIGREIKPRTYQIEIINECFQKYQRGTNKLLIEMATGLGKTYTVALLIKMFLNAEFSGKRVLFLAHQVEILLQTVTAFKNVFGIGNYSFSACFAGAAPENTDFVFGSFDTLYSRLDELKSDQFDYIIVDEAHHTPASTYRQVVETFSPKLLIGLTATPFRSDNKSVNEFFGGEEGHVGKYDLVWALANKKLAFPRYHVLLDDLDQTKIDQLESGLSVADLDKKLFLHKKDEEVVKIIENTVEERSLDPVKGIVFCRSISHMNHLIKFFKIGTAILIHSKQGQDLRRENLRKFREESFKYILVCDLFNEGVDIPETNLLVFLRYTGSQTIWLQQLGRGLRKTKTKDHVDVLDFVGSLERLNQVTQFSNAVISTKPDPKENAADEKCSAPILHDSSIDVIYTESAAKVLDLIQSLKYRLNSKADLIQKLREFYASEGYIPTPSQIELFLSDVSVDQIATHFGSYLGYIRETVREKLDERPLRKQVADFVAQYKNINGMSPSLRAVSAGVSFGPLPLMTEREIHLIASELFSDQTYRAEEVATTQGVDDSSVEEAKDNEPQSDDAPSRERQLLSKFVEEVKNRGDFSQLDSTDQKEILEVFRSPSIFISRLNRMRNA